MPLFYNNSTYPIHHVKPVLISLTKNPQFFKYSISLCQWFKGAVYFEGNWKTYDYNLIFIIILIIKFLRVNFNLIKIIVPDLMYFVTHDSTWFKRVGYMTQIILIFRKTDPPFRTWVDGLVQADQNFWTLLVYGICM